MKFWVMNTATSLGNWTMPLSKMKSHREGNTPDAFADGALQSTASTK